MNVQEHKNEPKRYKDKFSLCKLPNIGEVSGCFGHKLACCVSTEYLDCPSQVAVVTKMQPVRNNGCYDTIVRVRGFDRSFTLAGGINLPKIINCHGDDGLQYKQVIKGNDDMRQDAVLQQVFQMVNRWLSSDAAARERRLHVLTYKVVPLSNQSGVLEWCANTQPLGEYLVRSRNPKAAHERYAPNDWLAAKCRELHKCKHTCVYLHHTHQPCL